MKTEVTGLVLRIHCNIQTSKWPRSPGTKSTEVHPRRPGLGSPARSIPAHTQVLELERFACLPLLAFGSRPRPLVQLWLFTRHAAGVLDLGLVKQGLRPALLGWPSFKPIYIGQ